MSESDDEGNKVVSAEVIQTGPSQETIAFWRRTNAAGAGGATVLSVALGVIFFQSFNKAILDGIDSLKPTFDVASLHPGLILFTLLAAIVGVAIIGTSIAIDRKIKAYQTDPKSTKRTFEDSQNLL